MLSQVSPELLGQKTANAVFQLPLIKSKKISDLLVLMLQARSKKGTFP
jgi:hypothetical protein